MFCSYVLWDSKPGFALTLLNVFAKIKAFVLIKLFYKKSVGRD